MLPHTDTFVSLYMTSSNQIVVGIRLLRQSKESDRSKTSIETLLGSVCLIVRVLSAFVFEHSHNGTVLSSLL